MKKNVGASVLKVPAMDVGMALPDADGAGLVEGAGDVEGAKLTEGALEGAIEALGDALAVGSQKHNPPELICAVKG